ncbi:MAG: hypothetical protein LCI00_13785 [Chloroflexi bacterium]|nr:hypothetical protein [Chloroflexota bacterium]MCC6892265.1 hypothetical protein [Anaerolineae bacterium]
MKPEPQFTPPEWVIQIQARGLGSTLGLALDALEPLGVLGAQLVWVAQPVLSLWVGRETVQGFARTLETPGELEQIRYFLDQ